MEHDSDKDDDSSPVQQMEDDTGGRLETDLPPPRLMITKMVRRHVFFWFVSLCFGTTLYLCFVLLLFFGLAWLGL